MRFVLVAAVLLMPAGSGACAPAEPATHIGKASGPITQSTATLTVRFAGFKTAAGTAMLSLYNSEQSYAAGKPLRGAVAAVRDDRAEVVVTGLAPGRYAIRAFHDRDGDGKMATNPFGIPLEPFAFSNGAKPQGGPAPWAAASFEVPAGASAVSITFP